MSAYAAVARAHTNIALIKYWGKKNQELIIPANDSLSVTLDHFYTDTKVEFDAALTADEFYLNHAAKDATAITRFLDLVRAKANLSLNARVESINHVPTQAGLASSASAFAALALAASHAAHLDLSAKQLSQLARRGSGSACRSIFGGYVQWYGGSDDASSYAAPLAQQPTWDLRMIAVVVNAHTKKISSRQGMQRVVATSPYYPAWVKQTTADLAALKEAIAANDFVRFGQIAQSNAMKMHALNLSATPPFNYFEPASLKAIAVTEELQANGVACYYTMDAGPNVKIICQAADEARIRAALAPYFDQKQLLSAGVGPDAHLLTSLSD